MKTGSPQLGLVTREVTEVSGCGSRGWGGLCYLKLVHLGRGKGPLLRIKLILSRFFLNGISHLLQRGCLPPVHSLSTVFLSICLFDQVN